MCDIGWEGPTCDMKGNDIVLTGGGEMAPLLVLVPPCFRENVVVTCKIVVFFVYLR